MSNWFSHVLKWIVENKEWLFDGAVFAIAGGITSIIVWLYSKRKNKGLDIYHKLCRQGQNNVSLNIHLILGIENKNKRIVAKCPYFSITVPSDFGSFLPLRDNNDRHLDWKPVDKNRRQYNFRGGNNDVIHPKSSLEITRIHFSIPKNATVATYLTCFPSARIPYTIKAENFKEVMGEYPLTPDEIWKWMVEEQASGRLVPYGESMDLASGLIEKLKYDGDVNVKEKAVEELGRIGEPVIPVLMESLKENEEDYDYHRFGGYVVWVLAKIGETAIPFLKEALKDEDVGDVALQALNEIGSTKALKAIEEYESRDNFLI